MIILMIFNMSTFIFSLHYFEDYLMTKRDPKKKCKRRRRQKNEQKRKRKRKRKEQGKKKSPAPH